MMSRCQFERLNWGAIEPLLELLGLGEKDWNGLVIDRGHSVILAGDYNVAPTEIDIYPTTSWDDDALGQPESRSRSPTVVPKVAIPHASIWGRSRRHHAKRLTP